MLDLDRLDLLICDASPVSRRPILLWHEQLLWAVRADASVSSAQPLPVVMF